MDPHALETLVLGLILAALGFAGRLMLKGAKSEIITEVKAQTAATQSALDIHKAEDNLKFQRLDETDKRHEETIARIEQRVMRASGD